MERKIPLRRVIAKLKTDEIHMSVLAEHPNIEKGDKNYPSCFQKSVTAYISQMNKVEREQMESIWTEWQNKGPPLEVRLKWVSIRETYTFLYNYCLNLLRAARKYSHKAIVDAHQMLHKEMFMSCITYSFYPDLDDGEYGIVW